MAFDYTNLYPDTSGNGGYTKSWNYTTVVDSIATCSASGYFNKVATRLGIGDNIIVARVDAFDTKNRTVLVEYAELFVNSISGGVVTTINYSGNFIQAGTGAVTRTMQDKAREVVSVTDFGAVGNGTTDDTAAFNAALALGGAVFVPPGRTYKIAGTLNITVAGTKLFSESLTTTILMASTAAVPMINIGVISNVEIAGLTLDRTVTATSGGDGIVCSGNTNSALFADLFITHQYRGLVLGSTQQGMVRYVTITQGQSHGLVMQNNATVSQLQWFLETVGVGSCGGHGFYVNTAAGTAVAFLDTWHNCFTFANSGSGIALIGSAASPIGDARISDGFFGSDGNNEIAIQNSGAAAGAGGDHQIMNNFFESAGGNNTGPGGATLPTHLGSAISIDASVTRVTISGNRIGTMSGPGIISAAAIAVIDGNKLSDNSQAGAGAGSQSGISITGGRATLTGNFSGNTFGASQSYGAAFSADNGHVIVGNDFTGNSGQPIFPATLPNSIVSGNAPLAGNTGEYISSTIAIGSALALTSGTPLNVTSIAIPAGEWDVEGVVNFTGPTTTTVTYITGSISTTSATLDLTNGRGVSLVCNANTVYNNTPGGVAATPIPRQKFVGPATIYLVAQSLFATSTSSAFGVLRARRVRY